MVLPSPTSWAEEQSLLIAHQNGNPDARARLIEGNLRYAVRASRLFADNFPDKDDRFEIFCEALIRAVDTYNPARGASLKTYVNTCVRHKFIDEIRQDHNPKNMVSMDAHCQKTDEEGESLRFHDVIASSGKSASDIIIEKENGREIQSLLTSLPQKWEQVLSLRYKQSKTQRDAAQHLGKSKTWILNQERLALAHCREKLRAKYS